jgi:hypothetical protein
MRKFRLFATKRVYNNRANAYCERDLVRES